MTVSLPSSPSCSLPSSSSNLFTFLFLGILTAFSPLSHAFSFNTSVPTQCNDFTVTWDGGTEPFHLLIVPTNTLNSGKITNISIPNGSNGQYTFQLSEPAGLNMLLTMWDATGFGAGGTTSVLTVGSSSNGSCLDQDVLADFYFSLNPNSNPSQCSTLSVSWNSNVSLPVSLYGLIPSGSAFNIPIPQGGTYSYDWTVDIASGTEFLLLMSDAGTYQTGGSSSLLTVQGSGDSSCLNSSSPASATLTSGGSTATNSGASSGASNVAGVGGSSKGGTSANGVSGSQTHGSGTNLGAIVGGVVGGIVGIVIVVALLYFFCLRGRKLRLTEKSGTGWSDKFGRRSLEDAIVPIPLVSDPRAAPAQPFDIDSDESLQPSPFVYRTPSQAAQDRQEELQRQNGFSDEIDAELAALSLPALSHSENGGGTEGRDLEMSVVRRSRESEGTVSGGASGSVGAGNEKATAMRLNNQRNSQLRLVQHEDGGNIVELPPRYDQLRARNADDDV